MYVSGRDVINCTWDIVARKNTTLEIDIAFNRSVTLGTCHAVVEVSFVFMFRLFSCWYVMCEMKKISPVH